MNLKQRIWKQQGNASWFLRQTSLKSLNLIKQKVSGSKLKKRLEQNYWEKLLTRVSSVYCKLWRQRAMGKNMMGGILASFILIKIAKKYIIFLCIWDVECELQHEPNHWDSFMFHQRCAIKAKHTLCELKYNHWKQFYV